MLLTTEGSSSFKRFGAPIFRGLSLIDLCLAEASRLHLSALPLIACIISLEVRVAEGRGCVGRFRFCRPAVATSLKSTLGYLALCVVEVSH